jgi:nitrate reductase NapA
MEWNRRDFLKASVAVGAATAVGMNRLVPLEAQAQPPVDKWGKAPCRFCGVGCGVLVGVCKGKVEALGEIPSVR